LPFAFTEHGALMAANILNNPRTGERVRPEIGLAGELMPKIQGLKSEVYSRKPVFFTGLKRRC
jgi:hypothetical protein